MIVLETLDAADARVFVMAQYEMARCKFFSRSSKYKILPYGFALAKNCLGEGETRDEAWLDAQKNMKAQEESK